MTENSQAAREEGTDPRQQDGNGPAPQDSLNSPPSGLPVLVPFGKYLLDREIASGGMARVYLARLRGLGGFEKKLVVKQVRPELASDPRFLSLFVQEANTLVQMSHPHIVPVYELGVVDGVYFLAMEYVEGATLAELLRFQKPFPAALAFYIAERVAEALSYAHTQFGLVHRDVTPNNIMVDRVGHVRLLDFGIAAPADGPEKRGDVFGSIGYMSPEQARGDAVSPASDLFSLGTVVFEALTGTNPWRREDRQSSLDLLLSQGGTPLPIGPGPTWIPEHIRRMVEALIQRDIGERPQSAAAVATTLRSWLSTEHPEGVGHDLVALVEEVVDARGSDRPLAPGEPSTSDAKANDGQTKSLATNTVLTALLHDAPKRTDPGADSKTAPVTGRFPKPRPANSRRSSLTFLSIALAVASVGFALVTAWSSSSDLDRATEQGPRGLEVAPRVNDAPSEKTTPGDDPPTETTAAEKVPAPVENVVRAQGTLRISADPWAQVLVDQRSHGETSRTQLTVPSGNHTVTLRCPPYGTSVRIPIEIGPRQSATIIADMKTDPPTVRRTR